MTPKELKALLKVCKEFGVLKLKTAEVELEMTEQSNMSPAIDNALNGPSNALDGRLNTGLPMLDGKQLTEDDLLTWSSGV